MSQNAERVPVLHNANGSGCLVIEASRAKHKAVYRLNVNKDSASVSIIQIGRAWGNDLILDDLYIDPEHLQLEIDQEGSIRICDLETKNGTLLAGRPLHEKTLYERGEEIVVGETTLQIHSSEDVVDSAKSLSIWNRLQHRLSTTGAVISFGLVALICTVLNDYLTAQNAYVLKDVVNTSFTFFAVLTSASLLMALFSKLLRNEDKVWTHWSFLSLSVIVASVVTCFLSVYRFNAQAWFHSQVLSSIVTGVFIATFIYGGLSIITFLGKKSRWLWSLVAASIPLAMLLVVPLLDEPHLRWKASALSEIHTLPESMKWRKGVSVDKYFEASQSLYDILDAQLLEK